MSETSQLPQGPDSIQHRTDGAVENTTAVAETIEGIERHTRQHARDVLNHSS